VKWHDEYAKLGNDPQETRKAMADEDQRLRHSALWLTPLRRQVFDEIVANRSKFEQVCFTVCVMKLNFDSEVLPRQDKNHSGCLQPCTTP
jgi:hypothetical protein